MSGGRFDFPSVPRWTMQEIDDYVTRIERKVDTQEPITVRDTVRLLFAARQLQDMAMPIATGHDTVTEPTVGARHCDACRCLFEAPDICPGCGGTTGYGPLCDAVDEIGDAS